MRNASKSTVKRKESAGDSLMKKPTKSAAGSPGKDLVRDYLESGELLTSSIRETLQRMDVGDSQILGPLARRGDIGPVVARINETRDEPMSITQSRCYLFHPDSGKTIQMVLVTRTA